MTFIWSWSYIGRLSTTDLRSFLIHQASYHEGNVKVNEKQYFVNKNNQIRSIKESKIMKWGIVLKIWKWYFLDVFSKQLGWFYISILSKVQFTSLRWKRKHCRLLLMIEEMYFFFAYIIICQRWETHGVKNWLNKNSVYPYWMTKKKK